MAKKNSGKKMIGKGLIGTAGGYAAANAILVFAPICPLACGAWLLANGAMAASVATTAVGGVKAVYEKGYNDKENENEKVNNKLKTEREFINDWHVYRVCHFIVDIINNNENLILNKKGYDAIMGYRVFNIFIDGDVTTKKLKFVKNDKYECKINVNPDIARAVIANFLYALEMKENYDIVDVLNPYTAKDNKLKEKELIQLLERY